MFRSARHPSHLRGKAIGLWYAQRSRATKSAPQPQPIATVQLSAREIQRATEVGQLFNDVDEVESSSIPLDKLHREFQYFEPLHRRPALDQYLFDDLQTKQRSTLYEKLVEKRTQLPISNYREEILHCLNEHQVFILVGETGSGQCLVVRSICHERLSSRQDHSNGSVHPR
jgi:HrpA-like RNA helicase